MAESNTLVSSSPSGEVRLVHLILPSLTDDNIKSQVQQTHSCTGYEPLRLQRPFVSISHILKPVTRFVDSVLLDKKVNQKRFELKSSNLLEFHSALSELRKFEEGFTYFGIITQLAGKAMDKAEEMFDEINVDRASMRILQFLSDNYWDVKAEFTMGSITVKFLDLLELLLHGPNQPSIELASSMRALRKTRVSLVGTPIEKFQRPLDELNNLIKMTLQLFKFICELTLLQGIKFNREELVSKGVYWAILSTVAGHIQMNFIIDNDQVALDLSHLISNLGQVLDDLKHYYTICKPQLEEMEAHIQSNAFYDDIFSPRKSSNAPIDILMLMRRFTYSKDGHQSLIDGSTMSKVEIEVLKGKTVLLLISNLDISTEDINRLLEVYEETREEDYYKIVWIPFVLNWTQELRDKFENLKSKMPWYIVCYHSPIEGLWYFKGRWIFEQPVVALINHLGQLGREPASIATIYIHDSICRPSKRIAILPFFGAAPPSLPELYIDESTEGCAKRGPKAGVPLSNPSSGFHGLLSISKNKGAAYESLSGKEDEGRSLKRRNIIDCCMS